MGTDEHLLELCIVHQSEVAASCLQQIHVLIVTILEVTYLQGGFVSLIARLIGYYYVKR